MKKMIKYMPGLIFVLLIAYSAKFCSSFINRYISIEALTIAIILGILYNNTIGTQEMFKDGVKFSLKKLLKVGIVLLGFKLNIHDMLNLGPKVIVMVLVYVPAALIGAIILGKFFKVEKKLATLIGVGSCICGASAVVALTPCIDADEEDSVVAVSIVSFLGTIGVLIYSAIATSGFDITPVQYGAWSGLTLHGVAHALAAAFAFGEKAGEIGTFVKMTRVLMLVPVSLGLSFYFSKQDNAGVKKAKFPMYVAYFVLVGAINSVGIVPKMVVSKALTLSSLCILMAMTAMGLSVDFKSIIDKGIKAFGIGAILFSILSSISLIAILNML